ncbi:hypothetical protein BCD96_000150 [Clostridium beijerinckii]|nr:hypothetical protein [Clostridium beijerinckii]NRU41467.1 hypothetical protein [Clostridium beijerinckii]NSA95257.1 hypothetical protein [Clostridium beijerinckii]CUU45725.1 protein of unknown function [Clostridium beijerinckii]
MSKKFFSNEEINILSKNKYVKRVSEKGITYTDEFKRLFIAENEKGKFPREIFEECGFDINIIGLKEYNHLVVDGAPHFEEMVLNNYKILENIILADQVKKTYL